MRVLIVGGTGVISTPLSARLIAAGHEVVHYNRGERPGRGPAPAATILGDRTDLVRFEAQMAEAGRWDCVYDMVVYRPEEAASAVRAFRGRTKDYVFCSTVDVYAKPAPRYPVDEGSPLAGVSAYGIAKRACEAVFNAAAARGELEATILRPAYTYGPGARGVLHSLGFDTRFLERLRRGLPVIVHGDGEGLWSACAAEDAAAAFAAVPASAEARGRAYNIASDDILTWRQYVRRIAGAMHWPEPTLVAIPTNVLVRVAPDRAQITAENLRFNNIVATDRARADLGLDCSVALEDGMGRLIAWLDTTGRLDRSADAGYTAILDAWQKALARL